MNGRLLALLRGNDGGSMLEYALVVCLIAVIAIGAVTFFGHATSSVLNNAAMAI